METRRAALDQAIVLLDKEKKEAMGITDDMTRVIPKTPFKAGTMEHVADHGAHITVAMAGKYPTKNSDGKPHEVTEAIAEYVKQHSSKIKVTWAPQNLKLLPGREGNDEAVGAVLYFSATVDKETHNAIVKFRNDVGLGDPDPHHIYHVSLAGVCSKTLTLPDFRAQQNLCEV